MRSECPLGFRYTPTGGGSCICDKLLQMHGFKCDINSLSFTTPPHYWVGLSYYENGLGYHLDEILLSTHCPPNYCKNSLTFEVRLDLNVSFSGTSCANNRSGKLCGQCSQNYSAVFGSDTCYSNCSHLYLLTLPVYALAGILLVVHGSLCIEFHSGHWHYQWSDILCQHSGPVYEYIYSLMKILSMT